ncbi:hypothetical protein AC1031_020051 [Aphanomyces cochlioides]|nr:hypothetical protein AC1031_020051 [Aphanomyces cochlioides]
MRLCLGETRSLALYASSVFFLALVIPWLLWLTFRRDGADNLSILSFQERCELGFRRFAQQILAPFWRIELALLALFDPATESLPHLPPTLTSRQIQYSALFIFCWKVNLASIIMSLPVWIWGFGLRSLLVGPFDTMQLLAYWTLLVLGGLLAAVVVGTVVVQLSAFFYESIVVAWTGDSELTGLLRTTASSTYESVDSQDAPAGCESATDIAVNVAQDDHARPPTPPLETNMQPSPPPSPPTPLASPISQTPPPGSGERLLHVTELQKELASVEASIAEYEAMVANAPNLKLRRKLAKECKSFGDRRQKILDEIAAASKETQASDAPAPPVYIPLATSRNIEISVKTTSLDSDVLPPLPSQTPSESFTHLTSYFTTNAAGSLSYGSPVFRGTDWNDGPSPISYEPLAQYDRFSPVSSPLHAASAGTSSFTTTAPIFRSLAASSTPFNSYDEDEDAVHMVAYAPQCVQPTTVFGFSVWAFLAHQRDAMHEEAIADAPDASQMSRDVLFPLRHGARAHITLEVPSGFTILNGATQAMTWAGVQTNVTYQVACDDNAQQEAQVLFKASIVLGTRVMFLRAYLFVTSQRAVVMESDEMAPVMSELEMLEETFEEIPYRSLQLKELVGRGYFGDAYRADYNGRDVVVKTIRASEYGDSSDQIVQEFRHEAAVLNMFGHHPNIVPFVGASTDLSEPLSLVTEYLPCGTIEDQVDLTTAQKMQILIDAAAGLLNIHDGGFVHRDIAARNCLVDANRRAKICDFGLCRRINQAYGGSFVQDGVGPIKYMAPESLQPPHAFSYKSDAYSYGVLMWETFTQTKPFADVPPYLAAARVLEGGRLDVSLPVIPPSCRELMEDCFQEDPTKRPSMHSILVRLLEAK